MQGFRTPLYLALVMLIHCVGLSQMSSSSTPKLPKRFQPIPLVIQETEYSCGAASVLAVLRYWDLYEGDESELYLPLETDPQEGTHPERMLAFLSDYAEARMEEGVSIEKLKAALENGETAILDIQAYRSDSSLPWKETWEDGHYVVAVAVDDRYVYAMDPSMDRYYGYVSHAELLERWHDYEIRDGELWKNKQLALFVKGTKAIKGPRREVRPLE